MKRTHAGLVSRHGCGRGELPVPVCPRTGLLEGCGCCSAVTVSLDNRGRAPVLARCNVPDPSPRRHPVRTGTCAGVPGMMRSLSRSMVVVRGHGMVSWPLPEENTMGCHRGSGPNVSLLSATCNHGRSGGSAGESEPVDTSRGRMRVYTNTSVVRVFLVRTHTLIRESGAAALKFVK